jgi:DNA-binding NtrC family response regulator
MLKLRRLFEASFAHCSIRKNEFIGIRLHKVATQTTPAAPVGIVPLWITEKQTIEDAIAFCGGNVPKAAALLDISASTIYRKRQSWEEVEGSLTQEG